MWRLLIDEIIIFLIPFGVYALYQAVIAGHWRQALRFGVKPAGWLTVIGLIFAFSVIRRAEGTMVRIILDGLLVFLIPFVAYAGYQMLAQRDPRAALRMSRGPFLWLTIAGLVLCIGSIIAVEISTPPHQGGYQRAIWKDGKLIQGEAK